MLSLQVSLVLLLLNSFYRVGGNTRISGFLLAAATVLLLVLGTGPIAFIRTSRQSLLVYDAELHSTVITAVMVVGALIFVLGIDLVKEALWDTRHRVTR